MTTKASKSQSPPQDGYSINALSSITGFDRRTLSKHLSRVQPVRAEGKTKFYRLEDVQNAIAAKPDKNLKDEKLSEEIRKLRIKNDRDEGKLILKADVSAAIRRILGRAAQTCESKLVNELPISVSGLTPPEARVLTRKVYDSLMEELQKLAVEFPE